MPETPCGKCSACPCSGSKKDKRQADQSQAQHQPQPAAKSPNVECLCVSRRRQGQQTETLQTPMADTYTCTRARAEPMRQIPMEERCTCRLKPTPAQCECAPPVQPEASCRQVAEPMATTRAQITCGQPIPYQQNNQRPQYTQSGPHQCGHCQAQQRKKKCVIQ
ncbi:uncharacterized protein LOC117790109 [Drosophila innubila]|uniref:uncharacterized protein LOC117790109 n=1 Tax=Drosophila innubila TaxID=198719 RepID=UPI00148C32B3|nr:uncharacterized protein LOC117790109 [Drosophila innubila]